MRTYFYPLCTKDFTFENIFSSESISPPNFYPNRGYGIDYFYIIPQVNFENFIALYNEPPKYESAGPIKFILEVSESCLDVNELILLGEGIVGYQKTIYLNKNNFKIHFFSEKEKKITMLQSETSLPTKAVKKYKSNFHIIKEESCRDFELNLKHLKIDNKNLEKEIQLDRRYNYFKGFIYGIATGLIGAKSQDEIRIKRYFQEITNSFAELKNRVDDQNRESSKYYSSNKGGPVLSTYINRLQQIIGSTEELFYELFPNQKISEGFLAKFLSGTLSDRFKSIEDSQKYIDYLVVDDEILGTNKFSKLKSYFVKHTGHTGGFVFFETLKDQINYYVNNFRYSNSSRVNLENANDTFKDALFALERYVSTIFLERTVERRVILDDIKYDFLNNQISIIPGFLSLNADMTKDIQLINNAILKFSKFGKGAAPKETILQIIEQVGSTFSKTGKPTLLYKYINNEIDVYSIEKASNLVMKNFVAFAFNPDSLEKLENFVNSKGVEESWIAYSFWCSYNGFANVSRNFTKPVFDTDNSQLQDYLDAYLEQYLKFLQTDPPILFLEKYLQKKPTEKEKHTLERSTATDKRRDFYFQFVHTKYKISLEEFYSILKINELDEFSNELKNRFKISKKDAVKLYNSLVDYFNSSSLF